MTILAITGLAGSGKTTLSNRLADLGWKQTKFAAPIKAMITEFLVFQGVDYSMAYRMLDGDLKEVPTPFLSGRTPRHAMQTLGTEWRDLIDRNLWVDAWKRNILGYPDHTKIVVDDVRFLYEAMAVRSLGGVIVRIDRPNNPQISSSTHVSEIELERISTNGTIQNNAAPTKMLHELEAIIGSL